uniref:Uncharacterized protein n=1 Tax=Chromera velia CCMP2878 TaxID=1169474 RepID=A0A0G4FBL2_9ALVE|eukprot:Cvel_16203.t1-p1 / transcript=Cvel_16203.t1 / gene=Cvel_16203 / organism=Chromera_velia_CCMP2878 / gene_product=hypothetical protein / transcript_product=hypothetical protein / location=Cvel_scaffold1237:50123-51055(-) / protein_length=311 / sequence_SO=supercontig / SO=protein_coding / is_pseudo=false
MNKAGRKGSGENDDVINRAATAAATAVSNTLIPKFTEITTALEGFRLSTISRDEAVTLIGQAEQRVEVRLDHVEMIVEEERVFALLEWVEKEKALDHAKRGTAVVNIKTSPLWPVFYKGRPQSSKVSRCPHRRRVETAEEILTGAVPLFPPPSLPLNARRYIVWRAGHRWGMSWRIKSFFYRSTTDMRGEPSHTDELKLTPGDAAALLSAYDEARNKLGIEEGRPLPLFLPTDTEILNRKIVMHPGASPLFRFFGKVNRVTRAVEGGFATEAQQNLKDRYHAVMQDFRKVTGPTSTRVAGLTERLRQFSAD